MVVEQEAMYQLNKKAGYLALCLNWQVPDVTDVADPEVTDLKP